MPRTAHKKARPVRRAPKRTAHVKTAALVVAPAPERPWVLTSEEIKIVKNSIAKGATDEELKFCFTVARRYKLDPFKQQIWFVKRWDKEADNGHGGKGTHVWTPQVGINGLLFAAGRDHAADFGSVSLPEYGPMHKVHNNIEGPMWARVKVWKKGSPIPTEAEVWWNEYAPAEMDKAPFWRRMPRRMLGKCATALALRQAYPDLGGLYIPEECARMEDGYTPSGRQIVEAQSSAAQQVAQRKIEEHGVGKTITVEPEPEAKAETITMKSVKDGWVLLTGKNGLAVIKSEIAPEEFADLNIKIDPKGIVYMPEANVFKLQDRAERCGVKATFVE